MSNKLYFKYGTMGSGKTALALMCKFNYEQKGFNVLMLKSSLDTRDVVDKKIIIKTRIGITSPCTTFDTDESLINLYLAENETKKVDVIIVDECQFATSKQIDQLHKISQFIPVICYGLLTDFQTKLFEGSKRLIEVAESIQELKSVCTCGKKSTINARFIDGKLELNGDWLGIEDSKTTYQPLCYSCYQKHISSNK